MEDAAVIRGELESAIEREDQGRAFALGLLYIGDAIYDLAAQRETKVEQHNHLGVDRGQAGGLDTLFDAFVQSAQGRAALAALGIAPVEAKRTSVPFHPLYGEMEQRAEHAEAARGARAAVAEDRRDATFDHPGCARRGGVCDCGERPCGLERAALEEQEPPAEYDLRDEPAERAEREADERRRGEWEQVAEEEMDRLDAEEEPPPDRHPQIPEAAWQALNYTQRRDVDDLVERLLRAQAAATQASNPTDQQLYSTQAENLTIELTDEWGIQLLPEAAVDAQEREGLTGGTIPPPAARGQGAEQLQRRRAWLRSRVGLPAEAAAAREEELARIGELLAEIPNA